MCFGLVKATNEEQQEMQAQRRSAVIQETMYDVFRPCQSNKRRAAGDAGATQVSSDPRNNVRCVSANKVA
jgi:hypothetical protein